MEPVPGVPAGRRYVPGTMVLETTWMTRFGWLIVRDALLIGLFFIHLLDTLGPMPFFLLLFLGVFVTLVTISEYQAGSIYTTDLLNIAGLVDARIVAAPPRD